MADTIRESIISELLSTITNYSSYTVLSSPNVKRGLSVYDPNVEDYPIISILPRQDDVERSSYGHNKCSMQVDISCIIKLEQNNPSELAESVLGELHAAALSVTPTGSDDIYYANGGIDSYPDSLTQSIIVVGISIIIVYCTDIGDPYNLTV